MAQIPLQTGIRTDEAFEQFLGFLDDAQSTDEMVAVADCFASALDKADGIENGIIASFAENSIYAISVPFPVPAHFYELAADYLNKQLNTKPYDGPIAYDASNQEVIGEHVFVKNKITGELISEYNVYDEKSELSAPTSFVAAGAVTSPSPVQPLPVKPVPVPGPNVPIETYNPIESVRSPVTPSTPLPLPPESPLPIEPIPVGPTVWALGGAILTGAAIGSLIVNPVLDPEPYEVISIPITKRGSPATVPAKLPNYDNPEPIQVKQDPFDEDTTLGICDLNEQAGGSEGFGVGDDLPEVETPPVEVEVEEEGDFFVCSVGGGGGDDAVEEQTEEMETYVSENNFTAPLPRPGGLGQKILDWVLYHAARFPVTEWSKFFTVAFKNSTFTVKEKGDVIELLQNECVVYRLSKSYANRRTKPAAEKLDIMSLLNLGDFIVDGKPYKQVTVGSYSSTFEVTFNLNIGKTLTIRVPKTITSPPVALEHVLKYLREYLAKSK